MPQNRIENLSTINSKKKPRIETAWVPLDGEVAEEYAELEAKVNRLRVRTASAVAGLKADLEVQLAEAEDEMKVAEEKLRKSSVSFKFKAIGRKAFDRMVDECPPTAAQIEEAKKIDATANLRYDPDALWLKLLPKAGISPTFTAEEAAAMQDDERWNEAELSLIWAAAIRAQQTMHQVNLRNLGNASRGTNGSVSN